MNFKKYHVSKNLLPFSDKTFTITAYSSNITVTCDGGNLYFSGSVTELSSIYAAWKTNFAFELEAGTYYCNNPSPLGIGFGRYIKKYSDDTNILTPSDDTFTLSETTKCYLAFYIYNKNLDTQIELMLNTGSTPLPYEPYSSEVWHDIPYYIHKTATDTLTLPAVIYPNDTSITVGIKGNTTQSGTPSPSNPVDVNGTGERTGNLINVQPFTIEGDNTSHNIVLWSGTLPVGTYTIHLNQDNALTTALRNTIRLVIGGTNYYESANENYHLQSGQHKMTFSVLDATQTIEIRYWGNSLSNDCSYSNIMFNTGSTALPYEPYGYFIEIEVS